MNFLEAHRIVSGFGGGPDLPFLLAMSGTPDKLTIFLRAAAAQRGRNADVRYLPFNTLQQWLLSDSVGDAPEAVLLLPWDLAPEADWRSGVPRTTTDAVEFRRRAESVAARIAARRDARIFYLPAPIPPLFGTPADDERARNALLGLALDLGAVTLPAECFSLSAYLSTGSPLGSGLLGDVAETIIDRIDARPTSSKKVLVTDLDNVMWHGVIGEDGLDGIRYSADGLGYRFFLYQSMLSKLEGDGVLIASVSRNDEELALLPFRKGQMLLQESQLVCILASYSAKSSQIAEIAARLNLGLDSFVFVDDNPLELAEVSARLPQVECIEFPSTDAQLPAFLDRLNALFARATVTDEDRRRTDMYRLRLQGMAPSDLDGADLTSFLRELDMHLVISDRSNADRTRAVQLINKTNQFNLNGRRMTDEEVARTLASGGRLYTASLADRNGSHGEILACLTSATGDIQSLVMSCRVFQRRVEYAFLAWFASAARHPIRLHFAPTERNEPIRKFLAGPAFSTSEGNAVALDPDRFMNLHAGDLSLFRLEVPERMEPQIATP